MIAAKKTFFIGFTMLAGFAAVFAVLFMPLFEGGQNTLNYLDNLYNSISKGSAYYIPDLREKNSAFQGRAVEVTIRAAAAAQAESTAMLFWKAGAAAEVEGDQIAVKGDLGRILGASLDDADLLFHNKVDDLRTKYEIDPRQVLFNWWTVLKGLDKELKKQKRFEDAKFAAVVQTKAVECAYNYFGIAPQKITDKVMIVIFSLAFYVLYTLWFGYAIMYLFEGWGMDLEH